MSSATAAAGPIKLRAGEPGAPPRCLVPPIKSQGIKTRLIPWLRGIAQETWLGTGRWIEPFCGTGVVGFNLRPARAHFCDANPHLIRFYQALQSGAITPAIAREFLRAEGARLAEQGADHYYAVRARFNESAEPLDFLFLNRCGFNGLIRFNAKGAYNVPFGHKPGRFSKAYVTKIANQIAAVAAAMREGDWVFRQGDFREAIAEAASGDLIYCDPPYAGRHADYFNAWSDADERALHAALKQSPAQFMLSTWLENQHRANAWIEELWSQFRIERREHFYHLGGVLENRKPMIEGLVLGNCPAS